MKIILSNEKARGFLEPAGQLEVQDLKDYANERYKAIHRQCHR